RFSSSSPSPFLRLLVEAREPVSEIHRVDHREFFFLVFSRHDLEGDPLQVVAEEEDALVRPVAEVLAPAPLDELDPALSDDIEGPLPGDAVLRGGAGKAYLGVLRPSISSDTIAALQLLAEHVPEQPRRVDL